MNKITAIIKPVVEEVGKFGEAAKGQVTASDSKQGDDTKDFIKDIYKPGEEKSAAEISQNKVADKEKLAKTRAKLKAHQEYFQRLTNPPKPKDEPVAEKLEREKKQEMVDLQKKEDKKPAPIAVSRAQNIEKFRGSSG